MKTFLRNLIVPVSCIILIGISSDKDALSEENLSKNKIDEQVDQILSQLELRYSGVGFSAEFVQESTIKAMEITDTATGNLLVKRPDKMRWEYKSPDPQLIVSNGKDLWVYRPDDNQVMIGKSPKFFGGGKGAGFLSDLRLIRSDFEVFLDKEINPNYYNLKLIPFEETMELSDLSLLISKTNYDVFQIVSYNPYGDETRIVLKNVKRDITLEDALFSFDIPEGVEVLKIE